MSLDEAVDRFVDEAVDDLIAELEGSGDEERSDSADELHVLMDEVVLYLWARCRQLVKGRRVLRELSEVTVQRQKRLLAERDAMRMTTRTLVGTGLPRSLWREGCTPGGIKRDVIEVLNSKSVL